MTDEDDKQDELLDKLDGLMRSGRGRKPQTPPPLLTEAVADPRDSAIPTLTDAVDSQRGGTEAALDANAPELDKAIASRLVASIDREMADLSRLLPAHRYKLAVLHRSIRFALPELVRLRWQEQTETEQGDDTGDAGEGPAANSGSDPV